MIRLAVAGMAHPHIHLVFETAARRDDVTLVAISDPEPGLREKYGAHVDVPAYTDHRELLANHDVDVVAVASVYSDRAAVVVDALRAGAHVIADKPLCTELSDVDLIEKAAAESGKDVALLFTKRYSRETVAARKLLVDGALGQLTQIATTGPHKLLRPTRPDWFFRRATYGGILGDLAVHDVDLVLWLTGATEGVVSGAAGSSVADLPEFTNYGSALLRAGSVTATLEVNWLTPSASPYHGDYRMRLTGTEGVAELYWARDRLVAVTNDAPPYGVELEPAVPGVVDDVLDSISAGERPVIDTAASLAATRIALLAQQSADTGGEAIAWSL